jgi:hypothetical protein
MAHPRDAVQWALYYPQFLICDQMNYRLTSLAGGSATI